MGRRVFLIVFFGFTLGVLYRSFFNFGLTFSYLPAFVGIFIGAFLFFRNYVVDPRTSPRGYQSHQQLHRPLNNAILFSVLFLVTVSLGALRYDLMEHLDDRSLDPFIDQQVSIEGCLVTEPDVRENVTRLTMQVESVAFKQATTSVRGKVLLAIDRYPVFEYGDCLQAVGVLELPENQDKLDEREFNYIGYLAKDGIFYELARARAKPLGRREGSFVAQKLFSLKHAFLSSVSKTIPEPQSSLLGGLVVGSKQSLGKELQKEFQQTGLVHIVVLSGYNLTIIAEAVMRMLAFLPLFFRVGFGMVGLVLFAMMVGGGATVIRASVMALIALFAQVVGREYDVARALLLAALLMLVQNPRVLVFDPSFQLSFMATLGVIYVSPIFEHWFSRLIPWDGARSIVATTISTQIFLLPVLLYMTGTLSIVALPINLLVLPLVPAAMLFGFLAGVLGMLHTVVALPMSYLAYAILAYILAMVHAGASLPMSAATVQNFPFAGIAIFYLLFGIFFFLYQYKTRQAAGLSEASKEKVS